MDLGFDPLCSVLSCLFPDQRICSTHLTSKLRQDVILLCFSKEKIDPQVITLKSIIVTQHREITTAAMLLITEKQSVVDEKENIKHMELN